MTGNATPLYSDEFFASHWEGARQSARQVVPLVLDMVHPRTVVDVGCGIGAWLASFADAGIEDYLGVDQHWVPPRTLTIPRERFLEHDLEKPLALPRRFDLAVSVEVAEHLAPDCASTFITTLTGLAPVVLFSAAVPGQGGVHHVNEQWPEYWAELFAAEGYQPVDALRPLIWNNPRVEWWYQQNLMLYVETAQLSRLELKPVRYQTGAPGLTRIHLEQYRKLAGKYEAQRLQNEIGNWPLGKLLRALPGAVSRAARRIR